MNGGTPSDRIRVRRMPSRGRYDREAIDAILDASFLCHVGFAVDGQPFVIPTLYGRRGDEVLLHGSAASRLLRRLGEGIPASLAVTLLDGMVLARSLFHHSANYRSVVLLGEATEIEDREEKLAAVRAISDHLIPGRWEEARAPTAAELAATSVLRMPIDEASAKVRSGPPGDEDEDYALEVWAGVVPLRIAAKPPVPDPRLGAGIPVPKSVEALVARYR